MNRPVNIFVANTFVALISATLLLASTLAHANLTAARGQITPKQISTTQSNLLSISWQVGVTPGHSGGISSGAPVSVIDPATSTTLVSIGGTLAQGGSGPFTLSETLTISAAQTKVWFDAGIRRVIIRRTFVGGTTVLGEIPLSIVESSLAASRSTAAELDIQRLRIALDEKDQAAAKVVSSNEVLQPELTVNYAGSGLLEGKWQIAEPGSTEGTALYRTLALVRQPLVKSQQSTLKGPVLPTHRSGKYLLRFCVATAGQSEIFPGGDSACPIPELTVQVAYQVLDRDEAVKEIMIRSPQQQSANDKTPFVWQAVPGSVLYKLDIFEVQGEQQLFVAGILLPQNQTQTPLTEIVQQKLSKGGLYLWQVSAVNEQGKVLAKSKPVVFNYQP